MTPAVEQFSFLNRWFIFRRKGDIGAPAPTVKAASIKATVPAANTTIAVPSNELEGAEELLANNTATGTAAVTGTATGRRQYAASEVLQFYQESPGIDRLKIGDKYALRWIAPGSPFPISDPVITTETYPSIEHFLAGMRYKVATDKPGLAQALFSATGTIHQKFLRQRDAEKGIGAGAKPLSEDRDAELLTAEMKEVHDEMRLTGMKKRSAKFNDAKWNDVKDDLLKEAVRQRYAKDARYRTILEAAKQQGKTLLFYTGSASSEYGGKQTKEKYLEGENKLGKAMMEIAGFEV
jgi:predicted NAD-dependent protein-ADP-ribosyltransferase YbiA (DUF1768 family)